LSNLSTLQVINSQKVLEMGPLQEQLRHGEYDLLKFAPMLESDFVQISKRGEMIDVHNQIQTITVAVACTSPSTLVPNVLLLARPLFSPEEPPPKFKFFSHPCCPAKRYELTRLFPLCLVRISIHNLEKQQLRFKLASGRTFYLQLCSQPGTQGDLFGLWVKVVNMLRPPLDLSIKSHRKTTHETSRSKVYCLSIANFYLFSYHEWNGISWNNVCKGDHPKTLTEEREGTY
uniref:Golgi associated RAB2 interactor protein-like Rab2B-binding domain-containing protein n=1 Tax=Pseudonaja textilis TaxID=8673 RepID=A0A670ZUQ8_PSETE